MNARPPQGVQTLTPYLIVSDADAAIAFYKKAFGAVEECRLLMPGTTHVMHATLSMGNAQLMLTQESDNPNCASQSPSTLKGTPVSIHIQMDNVDEAFQQAVDAGAIAIMPPMDMFWGDRFGKLKDPFGHEWSLATSVRQMTPEQMQEAANEFFQQHPMPV